jgi:hypothetical protein
MSERSKRLRLTLSDNTQVEIFALSHIKATVIKPRKPQYCLQSFSHRSLCFMMTIFILMYELLTWSFVRGLEKRVHWIYHHISTNNCTIIRYNSIQTCGSPPSCFGLCLSSSALFELLRLSSAFFGISRPSSAFFGEVFNKELKSNGLWK